MNERNQTIDIAKGAWILLVVLGHNPLVWEEKGELYRVIFSFHMPLFFFLSGVFLNPDKGWGDTVREKTDALLKPYVMTLLPLILFVALFKGAPLGSPLEPLQSQQQQGQNEMDKVVLKYGKDPEMKKLAEEIIKAQDTEIAFMKGWLPKQPK